MKASDLTRIKLPEQRLAQSQKFLISLKITEEAASKIRNEALLELVKEGWSQRKIARFLGISQQRVGQLISKAAPKETDVA